MHTATSSPPLILLPGLAADADLLAEQVRAIPNSSVMPWIAPAGPRESLADYARRFAHAAPWPSQPGTRWLLGGFSFGSQVAQELVAHLPVPPRAIIGICAVRGREQFTTGFAIQQRLGAITPGFLQRLAFGPMARLFARRCGLDRAQAQRLVAMAQRNDPAFLTWSARACATWPATPDLRGVPIRHIHGQRDTIIPDPAARAEVTIPNAKHLITWTHADVVNQFILRVLAEA
jgi:pimeloyl-ACP methyl ester carboxylesterase